MYQTIFISNLILHNLDTNVLFGVLLLLYVSVMACHTDLYDGMPPLPFIHRWKIQSVYHDTKLITHFFFASLYCRVSYVTCTQNKNQSFSSRPQSLTNLRVSAILVMITGHLQRMIGIEPSSPCFLLTGQQSIFSR